MTYRRTRSHTFVPTIPALVLAAAAAVAAQTPLPAFPVTLQQAVQYATDNYPAIRASAARVATQESGVSLAQTAYLPDRKSTRLNSSHLGISYAGFCFKKKRIYHG